MIKPDGVPAAPNRCAITAEVLGVRQSPAFPDKRELDLKIIESRNITGPNFARPGEHAQAFAVGSTLDIPPGTTITAQAEFVGDEHGGKLRLTDVSPIVNG